MQSKPSYLFTVYQWVILLLVAGTLLASSIYLVSILPQLRVLLGQLTKNGAATCGCEHIFSITSHPFISTGIFALTAVTLYIVLSVIIRLGIHMYRTRQTLRTLQIVELDVFEHNNHSYTTVLFHSADVMVFTSGIWKPSIYISTSAQRTLTTDEMHAVLLHEIAHIKHKDILKQYLHTAFIDTFFFIPYISLLKQHMLFVHEYTADAYASRSTSPQHLLSALIQFFQSNNTTVVKAAGISSFAVSQARMRMLLAEPISFPHKSIALGFLSALCVVLYGLFLFSRGFGMIEQFSEDISESSVQACIQEYAAPLMLFSSNISRDVPTSCEIDIQSEAQMSFE